MSFSIGIGDILMLAGLAYSIGKALTSGRTGALSEFDEVQNQLFTISNALKLLSTMLHGSESPRPGHVTILEDETLTLMVENCSTTLKHLEKVLEKYPELRSGTGTIRGDEKTRRKWKQGLKENIKKIKWTTEGADLDKLRHNLSIHINALNLAIAARGWSVNSGPGFRTLLTIDSTQNSDIKTQVDLTHGMLQDIHAWYLSNLKNAPKQQEEPVQTTNRVTEISIESEKKADGLEIIFGVSLDRSGSSLLCPKASFGPEWLIDGGPQLFHCMCGREHGLPDTCKSRNMPA
jgi:hypothetical protein